MQEHRKEQLKQKELSKADTQVDTAEAMVIQEQQNILDWSAKVCRLERQLGKHIQALKVIVGVILRWDHMHLLVQVLLVMMVEHIL